MCDRQSYISYSQHRDRHKIDCCAMTISIECQAGGSKNRPMISYQPDQGIGTEPHLANPITHRHNCIVREIINTLNEDDCHAGDHECIFNKLAVIR